MGKGQAKKRCAKNILLKARPLAYAYMTSLNGNVSEVYDRLKRDIPGLHLSDPRKFCEYWFARFEERGYNPADAPRSGRPKKISRLLALKAAKAFTSGAGLTGSRKGYRSIAEVIESVMQVHATDI